MKNGILISDGLANISPTSSGAIEAPIVRAMLAIPAAADRSSGGTTAIKYDCLVGTSIWLMLKRRNRIETASGSVGISGTRMRRMFEGRWVKTIVFTNPNRDANRDASKADTPANTFAPKKIAPSVDGLAPNRR